MADIQITHGDAVLNVEISSDPGVTVQIDTPSLLIPVSDNVALVGPQGPPGPAGQTGSPGPTGPTGATGPPPTAAGQIYALHWPPLAGDTGYTVTSSPPPAWMVPGTWNFWLSSGANAIAGLMRISSVVGNQVFFDSWTPQ